MGGCPFAAHKGAAGNVTTEDVVFLCQEMGVETGIDLDAMIESMEAGLLERGAAASGDSVVMVASSPAGRAHANLLKVHRGGSSGSP